MYQKKEELISDIAILLQGYNSKSGHRLIGLIRKGLNDFLLLEHHHTFEELAGIIGDFGQILSSAQHQLDTVLQERAQLLSSKELKCDKQFLNSLKDLKVKEQEALMRLQKCNDIAMQLANAKLRQTMISLCQILSELQFDKQEITKETCTRMVFSFLWALNQFADQQNHQRPATGQKKHIDLLIAQTTKALQSSDVEAALRSYKDLIRAYYGLSKEEQARRYADIFILWFEMQFFDHRIKSQAV